jgi:hypothetical protein
MIRSGWSTSRSWDISSAIGPACGVGDLGRDRLGRVEDWRYRQVRARYALGMNTDVSVNVVIFQLRRPSGEQAIAHAPTQADDCVRQAWAVAREQHRAAPWEVTALHSEWEPSAADKMFIENTFSAAQLTYNFARPGPDNWEAAFAAARQTMAEHEQREEQAAEGERQAAERERQAAEREQMARVEQDSQHVAEHGQLLPVLWSRRSPQREILELLPCQELVPGQMFVTVATIARTPQGKIGMHHVTKGGLKGRSFAGLMEAAMQQLSTGLGVEVRNDPARPELGNLAWVRRDGPFAASAVALPDFHEFISNVLGTDRLVVGLPEPDTLMAVAEASAAASDLLRHSVLSTRCPPGPLVPTVLSLTRSGYTVLAER